MSNKCFVCATPYQINAAIAIAGGFADKADMYILFDLEHTIILLNRKVGETVEKVDRDSIVSFLKYKYHDKTKIIVPESIDEFLDVISNLN